MGMHQFFTMIFFVIEKTSSIFARTKENKTQPGEMGEWLNPPVC